MFVPLSLVSRFELCRTCPTCTWCDRQATLWPSVEAEATKQRRRQMVGLCDKARSAFKAANAKAKLSLSALLPRLPIYFQSSVLLQTSRQQVTPQCPLLKKHGSGTKAHFSPIYLRVSMEGNLGFPESRGPNSDRSLPVFGLNRPSWCLCCSLGVSTVLLVALAQRCQSTPRFIVDLLV